MNRDTPPRSSSDQAHAHEFRGAWPLVLAAMVGVGFGLTGLPHYTFGVFVKPLGAAFGWSRSEVAAGSIFLHMGTVLTSPFLGGFVDRFGARRIALLSLAGLAIGFFAVSQSGPSLGSFYAAWALLALLGCATTPLTWTRMINMRFTAHRGLALGLTLTGTGLASVFGPRLISMAIEDFGWRSAYGVIALTILLVALPLAALGTSSRARGLTAAAAAPVAAWGLTLREAMRKRAFVQIALGILLVMACQAGATVHLVPLLTDKGMSTGAAASLAGLMGIAVLAGRIAVGALIDRFHAPYVAGLFLPLPAVALIMLALLPLGPATPVAIVLLGLAAGAEVDLLAYLVGRYFGMKHYGRIYGVGLSMFALGAATGPFLAGRVFDQTGSYTGALLGGAVLVLIGAGLIATLGAYPVQEDAAA